MNAPERDSLLHRTTQLLGSGEPLRELIPTLFTILLESIGASAGALAVPGTGEPRIAYRFPSQDCELTAALECAAFALLRDEKQPLGSAKIAVAPMRFGGSVVGAVALARELQPFTSQDISLLEIWASILSLRLRQISIEEEIAQLQAIAASDQLTGIANRRALDLALHAEFERTRSANKTLSILILDIDYFKPYNDRYGHVTGDGTLRRVAQALRSCVRRPGDLVARFGGEEFVVVLPRTKEKDAIRMAERMRSSIFELQIPHEESAVGIVTISVGVATTHGQETDSAELIIRADGELYRAKEAGRNRVAAGNYLSESQPATRPGTGVHNLRPMRPEFVSRDLELADLVNAVDRSRLVTLAGRSGTGKTRLAGEMALSQSTSFHDGIWFVDVGAPDGARAILSDLASLLGLQLRGSATEGLVTDRLRNARALLVFDGCERTIDAVRAVVETLLRQTRWVKVLCLSRQALNMPGESVLRLSGLRPEEARTLFQRLALGGADYSSEEMALIDSVCKRAHYLPLAIQLLAAQASTSSLRHLERLVGESPIPLRALDDVIGWSIDLLDDRRKSVFLALSIFEGGFSEQAAVVVAEARQVDIEAFERKSLIVRMADRGPVRYTMLRAMHDFARSRLTDPAVAALRFVHFEYYATLAASGQIESFEGEGQNFAAALNFAMLHRSRAEMLSVANALTSFWLRRGHLSEGFDWLRAGLARQGEGDESEVALAYRNAGRICRLLSEFESAREYNERALSFWRAQENPVGVASALNGLALIAHTIGDFERAALLYEESLKQYELLDDPEGVAMAINNLGGLAMFRGDYADANRRLDDTIARAHATRYKELEALAISNLGELRFLQGQPEEALELAERSLAMRRATGDRLGLAATWLLLGNVQLVRGHASDAWQPLRDSLLVYREIGDARGLAAVMLSIACLLCTNGRIEEAARLVFRADAIVQASGAPLFGAERMMREIVDVEKTTAVEAPADFEAAFEDALASFR